jgi:23S rRNA (cytosine1962-C5)-methyltransferase
VAARREPALLLRPGREASARRRHPWVFAGAVERVTGDPGVGDTVAVRAASGEVLGRAAWSPASQLAARFWTFDPDEPVDEALIARRVTAAAASRAALLGPVEAARLVFAESDGLPGVVADRYGPWVVAQLSSAGAERWRAVLGAALGALPGVAGVLERSDLDVRRKEGLPERVAALHGEDVPDDVMFHEGSWRFRSHPRTGHKTGFYLDQRTSRAAVAGLAAGRRVLNVCCYTGAFSVAAASGGAASVAQLDSSAPALARAAEHLALNGLPPARSVAGDMFGELRRFREAGERYDLVVVDPPKLVHSAAQLPRATRAYKDLNLQAFHLLDPGGVLVTFSCSGLLDDALFQKVVAGAALDAGRNARIVGRLTQSPDHPVLLAFPEAAYLKGLVVHVE